MYIDKLKHIINHYDKFKQIALDLKWITINESHFEWFNKYPDVAGILMHLYEFPEKYIGNYFCFPKKMRTFARANLKLSA